MRGSAVYIPSTSVYISQRSASSAAASATAVVSEPPRPSVVIPPSGLTPWNPLTTAISPRSSAAASSPAAIISIRASAWLPSVIMPACQPVNERAASPMLSSVMAMSAADCCSPVEMSASSSRAGGCELISCAISSSSSVVSPMADTTTRTLCPLRRASAAMPAARRRRSVPARELPPNFCTISMASSEYIFCRGADAPAPMRGFLPSVHYIRAPAQGLKRIFSGRCGKDGCGTCGAPGCTFYI